MARSTRKSIAGSAAAAAKKVISRRGKAEESPAKEAPAKKAPAKKAPAKKAPAKKAPAKKAPAKKAPAKKAPAKKAPAKKTPAKKTSAATASAPVRKATSTSKATAKKTTAKKTAPADLVVKHEEKAWTKSELNEVLNELNEHAERLRQEVRDQEAELEGLMRDAGDGAGQDQADMGATSFERDYELTVVANARDMLAQTERALARIDDGTYGVCESCGNPVGKMRLMAFPRATLCLPCKQREERR